MEALLSESVKYQIRYLFSECTNKQCIIIVIIIIIIFIKTFT